MHFQPSDSIDTLVLVSIKTLDSFVFSVKHISISALRTRVKDSDMVSFCRGTRILSVTRRKILACIEQDDVTGNKNDNHEIAVVFFFITVNRSWRERLSSTLQLSVHFLFVL